ncbi:hypothetical protein [Flexibacterium corallicola]|uniref:hypothetical protein n=1 Tax=Flexibacterium corallicola TaxID=3037259 RepID=UPI00286EE9B1|nr:hypothetical protein [Pseudovibrio sp. M1P-2-3]
MIIANIATYPAREGNRRKALDSITPQVDTLNIALNGYSEVPQDLESLEKANFLFPEKDLKDVGKFAFDVQDNDDVFLCDDDIIYPENYTERLLSLNDEIAIENVIIGLHGVTYSDYYDGVKRSGRLVRVFHHSLESNERVNQLGTGTVYAKGKQLPSLEFMLGSSGYVDIRFARHAYTRNYPMICIKREANWLAEVKNKDALYLSVTNQLPNEALREVQEFCGLGKLVRT